MKTKIISAISFCLLIILFSACKKDNSNVPVKFYLTDNPAAYDEVNVEIIGMEVKTSKDTAKWYTLQTNNGVYNLLTLQNGITTVLAQGDVPQSMLKEVRLILGTRNTIKVNGQTYPLLTPSAEDSGLKIKIDKDLQQTMNSFTLDFDASLSIKDEGNNIYKLQPTIKYKL